MIGNLIFIVVVYLPMIILTVFLLKGKGAGVLAGYNTMSPEKKAKYNMKAICRFYGWMTIVFMFLLALSHIGVGLGISWLSTTGIGLALAVIFGGGIYAKKSKRFRKSDDIADESVASEIKTSKTVKLTTVCISFIAAVAVVIIFYYGETEPTVNVFDSGIQISGMYGVNVDFSEMTDILLLENSMGNIGVGRRTNGYGGFGTTLKGNFQSNSLGHTLLFVKTHSSPTIHIARENKSDIYLSFANGEVTRQLYYEIMAELKSINTDF